MKPKSLAGKVVWVTGASSGIGRAMALESAALGARVILSGRRRGILDEVAGECKERGGEAAAVLAFDLESAEARAEACAAAPGLLGPLDILVLNAGISQRSLFLETSPEAFDRIMNLDFHAQVDMARRCLPAMAKRGSGCLVAISSVAGLAGVPLRSAYSSAKHALAGFFQVLRAELSGTGIRVVTVFPGYVRTSVAHNALNGDGSPNAAKDPNIEGGAEPGPVARRVLKAVRGGAVEITPALDANSRLAVLLSRRAPALLARLSARRAGL